MSGKSLKPPKKEEENSEAWLITYADAVTLVLCFFILLFSVSEPKPSAYKQIADSFAAARFTQEEEQSDPMDNVQQELEIMVENNALEQVMSVEETEDGIQLELSSSSFYHSGSAKFKREAVPILLQVADVLRDFNFDAYEIQVQGHTDDVPMRSKMFASNWELSAARATNIVRFLIANDLKPELMQATGYADTRPKVPNLNVDGNPIAANRKLNRRIVIQIERVD